MRQPSELDLQWKGFMVRLAGGEGLQNPGRGTVVLACRVEYKYMYGRPSQS